MENQTIELTIPSHPRFLQVIRGVMAQVMELLSVPSEQAGYIILAVDEACSNIIRHSYMGNPDGKIAVSIRPGRNKVGISIIDYGKPWTPGGLPPQAPDSIQPGGLGLYIIHQVMDQVDYSCSDKGENAIIMVKTL